MIAEEGIKELVENLKERGAWLYHACQFADFKSYLKLGGIPSRELLESNKSEFTQFETDEIDHKNGVWDKVFLNLSDFGEWFAKGRFAVPNPYGPILLMIDPSALYEAQDVALSLRSAGGTGFIRERDSLCSLDDVDKLFSYPANSHFPYCCEIQSTQKLRELFNFHKAQNPEISCSIKDQRIPVDYIKLCIVDPYIICKNDLYKITKTITKELPEFRLPVKKRICLNERVAFYNEIVHVVQKDGLTLGDLLNRNVVISDHMHDWILGLVNNNLQYQLRRYVRYLKEGTIKPLVAIHNDKITATKVSPLFQDSDMVEDDGFYEQHINELSFDDLSPEGMGWDDIDWDSFNFD